MKILQKCKNAKNESTITQKQFLFFLFKNCTCEARKVFFIIQEKLAVPTHTVFRYDRLFAKNLGFLHFFAIFLTKKFSVEKNRKTNVTILPISSRRTI